LSIETTVTCRPFDSEKKTNYSWLLGLIMVAVLALGWKYPLLGFIVPIAMGTGVAGGIFRGRWVCGNLCPRGSFLDSWFSLVASENDAPAILRKSGLRWGLLVLLMGFMAFRLAQNPGEWQHWGYVFWQMCLMTTLVAVALGLRYRARGWCMICPVGTMAGSIGARKYPLQVDASCKACGLCESRCPMQLDIVKYRAAGFQSEGDCVKCSSCMQACPSKTVLSWPNRDGSS